MWCVASLTRALVAMDTTVPVGIKIQNTFSESHSMNQNMFTKPSAICHQRISGGSCCNSDRESVSRFALVYCNSILRTPVA